MKEKLLRNIFFLIFFLSAIIGLLSNTGPALTIAQAQTPQNAGLVRVVVVLSYPSISETLAGRSANGESVAAVARSEAAKILQSQQALTHQIADAQIPYQIILTTTRVLNSVVMEVDASQIEAIRRLPNVSQVYRDPVLQLDLTNSVPFIGAPLVWEIGATGSNVRVGVIDSGIAYNHPDFGSPAPPPAFSTKIVGGLDFVGDAYDPVLSPALVPDPDPMDQNGHGTFVAGIIGGYGVIGTSTTYGGPWDASTPIGSMSIGPGVAPEADLYALKVTGASGAVPGAAVLAALDWALDPNQDNDISDHLDVVNLSLGAGYGDAHDTLATAVDNAVNSGMLVVGSAGNFGDTTYIHSSPGIADRAISVAASIGGYLGIRVNAPASIQGEYQAFRILFNADPLPTVTADVVLVDDGTGPDVNDGCTYPFTNGAALTGNIALVDRGNCTFQTKIINAINHGATSVIVINNVAGTPSQIISPNPSITIPAVIISLADGAVLKANLTGLNATVGPNVVWGPDADTLANFSSRGPGGFIAPEDVHLKPDLSAPGHNIFSAFPFPIGANTLSGTSFSAAHISGVAALLRQLYPTWTPAQLKALIMNTAIHPVTTNTSLEYGPARVGVGRVDAANAANSPVIAYDSNHPELVSVSFGIVHVVSPISRTRQVAVRNFSATDTFDFDVSYQPVTDVPGTSFTISPNQISVSPGQTQTLTVTLNANPAGMIQPHTHDSTLQETQNGEPRHWLSEESGYLVLTPTGTGIPLRVPLYAIPRPASRMKAQSNVLSVTDRSGQVPLVLSGRGVNTGSTFPYDVVSLVSAFELQDVDPDEASSTGSQNSADVQYIGVSSDYLAQNRNLSQTSIFFGISTYGEWTSLAEARHFEVHIDTDRDGTAEFILYNWSYGAYTGGSGSDTFYAFLEDVNTSTSQPEGYMNYYSSAVYDSAVFNTNVVFLPVSASDLGLSPGNAVFDYWIEAHYTDWQTPLVVDTTDPVTYDVANPAITFVQGHIGAPTWYDLNGRTIPVRYNFDNASGESAPCVLLLHHHNVPGIRAERVCLEIASTTPQTAPQSVQEASGVPPGVQSLPSTGYPPPAKHSDHRLDFLALGIGLLLIVRMIWRRLRRSRVIS